MTGQLGRRPALSVDEAELRCSAIAKLAARDFGAVTHFARTLGFKVETWQQVVLRGIYPPLDTIGHALQRAAAENA